MWTNGVGRVLYALLKKPAPNNPNLVGERREIAMMAQDMKLLLKMVRRECHDRLADRLINSQMGWHSAALDTPTPGW